MSDFKLTGSDVFGRYCRIEQFNHSAPNEVYLYKVVGSVRTNSWCKVPYRAASKEIWHDWMEDCIRAICCGIDETKVQTFRIADVEFLPRKECDREALMKIADEMERDARTQIEREKEHVYIYLGGEDVMEYANRIRDAVNACEGGSDAPVTGDKAEDGTEAHDEGKEAADGGWTDLGSFLEVGTLYACSEQMHDAATWVEENGGLEAVKARLMPEGMEWLVEAWPRFEDDAPVKLGDMALIDGEVDMVEAVQLWIHGKPVIYGDSGRQQLERSERVKRHEKKATDYDGAECHEGDTVWLSIQYRPRAGEAAISGSGECGLAGVGKYDALKISGFFEDKGGIIFAKFDHNASPWCPASWLTHRNPDNWLELQEDMRIGANPTMDERIEWFERARELAKGVS